MSLASGPKWPPPCLDLLVLASPVAQTHRASHALFKAQVPMRRKTCLWRHACVYSAEGPSGLKIWSGSPLDLLRAP